MDAQQMLVYIAMMREIMKPLEPERPISVERPVCIGEISCGDWFDTIVNPDYDVRDDALVGKGMSDELLEEMLEEVWNIGIEFENEINGMCWYVGLPDQPVNLVKKNIGTTEVWEIRSFGDEDDGGGSSIRLAWAPTPAYMECGDWRMRSIGKLVGLVV